jgi:site-specific recombinase XerD
MSNQTSVTDAPTTVNCTVRKYLTTREVERLMDCARKHSRYGYRDATMILVAYRHGLRASEVCARPGPNVCPAGQERHAIGPSDPRR